MALLDFKLYFLKVQSQYLEMKADLADYNQAFKDGHITEDQLQTVKEEINVIEQNYQRLLYASYLLELPRRRHKKKKYEKENKEPITAFEKMGASKEAIYAENKSALDELRKELKKLKNQDKTH